MSDAMSTTHEKSRSTEPRCTWPTLVRLAGNRTGAIGMMFALMLLPLCGLVGLAVDYGLLTRAQTEIDAAADSATLIATTIAADLYTKSTNPDDTAASNDAIQQGRAAGLRIFATQITDLGYMASSSPDLVVTRAIANGTSSFTAQLNYGSTAPGYFANLFGFKNLPVSGMAQAVVAASANVDFHIIMDNSNSMLIGATQSDMDALAQKVVDPKYSPWDGQDKFPGPCPIACHFTNDTIAANSSSNVQMTVTRDFMGVARLEGIRLRLDIVQGAVADLISSLQQKSSGSNLYQVALYAFENPANNDPGFGAPTTVYNLGRDFSTASKIASGLQVPLTPISSGDTSFTGKGASVSAFEYAASKMTTSTQSGSAANHKQVVIIISDGVGDQGDWADNRQFKAMQPTDCDVFKNRKMQVYVLYTTYVPIPDDPGYCYYVANFAGNNVPYGSPNPCPTSFDSTKTILYSNMKSCASSPTSFFNASEASDINSAMQKILKSAIGQSARLTL